jgi:hypothetical protein
MSNDVTQNFSAAELFTEALRTKLLVLSLIKDIRTAITVEVKAVHPGTGNPPSIGTVDVQPLVQTVDGSGKLWNLGVTYGVPFCRPQSGGNAIVMDPAVGDIGLAVACDRDISSVLAAAGLAGPGSGRTHDISDLVYVFSLLSAQEVTQYILVNANGISIVSPGTIALQGAQINLTGPINANGATISDAGEITNAAGIVVGTHQHEGGTMEADGYPVTGTSTAPIP